MNDNDALLAELKKISAWADMQRKMTKWSLVFLAVFVPGMILAAITLEHRLKSRLDDHRDPSNATWYDVQRHVRQGEFDEAIRIGKALVQKAPLDPDGHIRLGFAYLAAGDVAQARERFAEAARLFPTAENQDRLKAVDERIARESAP